MRLTLKYCAQVRQAAGVESDQLSLSDEADIGVALSDLANGHGDRFRSLVLDEAGAVRPSLSMLVNNQFVPRQEQRALTDGDQITLISAAAGG